MYIPASYWYDPCQAAAETVRRLQTPLHYHLRRHDYIAFQKELASGTNPFIPDECGRTPLDLALLMMEDTIITSLCTSFPVDFLVKTLEHDAKYPAKFKPRYDRVYERLYDHPNALRLAAESAGVEGAGNFGSGAPDEFPRFVPVPFPSYTHDTIPTHVYDALRASEKERAVEDKRKKKERRQERRQRRLPNQDPRSETSSPTAPQSPTGASGKPGGRTDGTAGSPSTRRQQSRGKVIFDVASTDHDDTTEEADDKNETSQGEFPVEPSPGIFRPLTATTLQKLFQDQMVVVVEDAIQQPTRLVVRRRMGQLLSQMKGLLRVINLMLTCEPLRVQAMDFRLAIARRPADLDRELPYFVLEDLTFPYLFLATLQNLFEIYPYGMDDRPWNPSSIADARRLVNLVIYKRLRGHEVLHFLAQIPKYMCHFIVTLGPEFFKPSSELAQFLMHYAFCFDSPELFYFASRLSRPFATQDVFDWDNLIRVLSVHKKKFARFLIPLITCRLKERLQYRLGGDDVATRTTRRTPVTYPFEEKYLTTDFIKEFAQFFGTEDIPKLENILAWWRYEVARMLKGAPRGRYVPKGYVTTASVLPPPPPVPYLRPRDDLDTTPAPHRENHFDSRVHPL